MWLSIFIPLDYDFSVFPAFLCYPDHILEIQPCHINNLVYQNEALNYLEAIESLSASVYPSGLFTICCGVKRPEFYSLFFKLLAASYKSFCEA